VTVIEGFNARYLRGEDLPFEPELAVVDASFISLEKILEPIFGALATGGRAIALVKPQFEAGPKQAPRGVVRDASVRLEVLRRLSAWLEERGLLIRQVVPSRLRGPKGNVEFFALVERGEAPLVDDAALRRAVMRVGEDGSGGTGETDV
jgi:23S rRNA (cytidine1920-2'-O)/16S rRNA (cytidine1409-2'-O)-methyltransferase